MTRKRALIFLCGLGALAASAYAAPSATALGTTAFTCKAGTSGFSTEHCVPGQTGTSFGHVAVPEGTTTELSGSNEKTNSETTGPVEGLMKGISNGVVIEVTFGALDFDAGWTSGTSGGIPYVHFFWNHIRFTKAKVKAPSGKGCTVSSGEFATNEMVGTTLNQGMGVKIEPKEGTTIGTLKFEGCSIPALNGAYEVKGSLVGTPNGAVVEFTHASATEQGTLTVRGQKAGFEGKVTVSGRANSSESYTPLAFTTVEK